jgi:hypothetical protein
MDTGFRRYDENFLAFVRSVPAQYFQGEHRKRNELDEENSEFRDLPAERRGSGARNSKAGFQIAAG